MEIPEDYDCDRVSDAVADVGEDELRDIIPSTKFVETTTKGIRDDNGDRKTVGAIRVTLEVESFLYTSTISEVEDSLGLDLHRIRFDKDRLLFV